MPDPDLSSLRPVALRKENEDRLAIDWNDGHHSTYTWKHLRDHCCCLSRTADLILVEYYTGVACYS